MSDVVLYTRFSPRPYQKDCDSCDKQIEELRAWAKKHGHNVIAEFRDEAVSGALDKQGLPPPGMCDAIMALRKGYIFCVRDVSRTCRDVALLVELERRVKAKSARIYTLRENATLDDPQSVFIYRIFAAFAEYQRSFSREMTRAKCRRAIKEGRSVNIKPPFGWNRKLINKQWLLIPDEKEQAVLSEIYLRHFEEKESILSIMNDFNERKVYARCNRPWWYSSFYRVVQRMKEDRNPRLDMFDTRKRLDRGSPDIRVGEFAPCEDQTE